MGDVKGKILDAELRKVVAAAAAAAGTNNTPITCLELGTYTGYAAVRMARLLPRGNGSRLWSVEVDVASARRAAQLTSAAGVNDRVTIVAGDAAQVIPQLTSEPYNVDAARGLDLVFIDHWKELYLPHFELLCATPGLLRRGTVIVADNVVYPGAPQYLAHVRAQPARWHSVFHASWLEYSHEQRDGVEVTTVL